MWKKFKTQEETYYSDNITIVPREIVFIVIAIRYNVFSNKIEYKQYSPKTLISVIFGVRIYPKGIIQESTLVTGFMKIRQERELSNIFSSSEPVSFSLVNTIRVKHLQ